LIARHDLRTLAARPWKNGGGVTREIAMMPHGAGLDAFDWRASVATIDASGPFSAFPGVERTIVLLDGAGVDLVAPAFRHRLDTPLVPFRFDGATPLEARLLGGSSTDFNVMTRRARCRANVRIVCEASMLAGSRAGVAHVAAGRWSFGGDAYGEAACEAGHGFAWDDDDGPRTATPDAAGNSRAALIVVAIERSGPR
jgi:environmental stress-induced protein Ves